MEWLENALREVGQWASDDTLSRGLALVAGAAVLGGGWLLRLVRGRKPSALERIRIHCDVPAGQDVTVTTRRQYE